ncbi:hypothetical protein [Methanonatronarchaeum sp. AMET-Sl]|uniref:hypothetical protein n=1 Tax=Methanonatronarchaeum sp. AMET-Sl TaxID=3037654 RepID=UPI00244DA0CF|nr:hypothetical protein [Methanonatronarchaeum sp. AMET-Sl]WGI18088.1 hypothetical protein QEN48_03550 [Methanonatronarchaeum sp. AMET-Sl]
MNYLSHFSAIQIGMETKTNNKPTKNKVETNPAIETSKDEKTETPKTNDNKIEDKTKNRPRKIKFKGKTRI